MKARFDEIIGVTLRKEVPIEEIYFAVHKDSLPYIQTKYIHTSQIQLDGDWEKDYRGALSVSIGLDVFLDENVDRIMNFMLASLLTERT